MFFLVNMLNHNATGQRSLEDVVGILGHQMRALGHRVIWDPRNEKFLHPSEGINLIVEGFTEHTVRVIADAHAHGCRFVILATEEPSDRGFNQGTQQEMVKRQEIFPEAAKFCEGILHLVPGEHVTRWYSQFAPAAQVELGYADTLVRQSSTVEPTYDFGFYGSLSKRRHRLLRKLANASVGKKEVRVVVDFKEQIERDSIMREARVIVQIRKFDEMGLVSSSRCNTALCLGRPVVAESHLLSKPWDEVVQFVDGDEHAFLNACMMARSYWRGMHAAQFERFREKFTPEFCVGQALKQIGILENKTARVSPCAEAGVVHKMSGSESAAA